MTSHSQVMTGKGPKPKDIKLIIIEESIYTSEAENCDFFCHFCSKTI